MKKTLLPIFILSTLLSHAQNVMTPELLWQLGRVSVSNFDAKSENVFYKVTTPNVDGDSYNSEKFMININGGEASKYAERISTENLHLSPDSKYKIVPRNVKIDKVFGSDFYPNMDKSNVQIYESLQYRHWDTWEDGEYSHLFVAKHDGKDNGIDIMEGKPFTCPTEPFGGAEDFTWSPDSKNVIYVTKEKSGTEYTLSTNTDIFQYNLESKTTTNLTKENKGYDMNPLFSTSGKLAWLAMARDGYEADKNDIIIKTDKGNINITKDWDGSVNNFVWSTDENKIYFTAPLGGTIQLFEIIAKEGSKAVQLTTGNYDITSIVGETNDKFVVTRTDMNHAVEVYTINKKDKKITQITHVNDDVYSKLTLPKVEKRITKATDGKDLLSWVIYPPNFDKNKKYPTLLYCQGGPQSPLTQFYSFRWNFQLMASQGYIVIAPNRRGMHGYGVEWNEKISKDWGGQCMDDYLSAIDDLSKESYVDKSKLGCIGASFGGYSAFYLMGNHEGRFSSFIAHDGLFNLKSMYGTTEELFFVNWDIGGNYWDKNNAAAQKTYTEFDPSNFVDKWDSPILIIQGGEDFRVPIGQGLEGFQAAQLKGLKSKLLYFPEENHWILTAQNAIIWQREFYKWLAETL